MPFSLTPNHKLNCNLTNPLFAANIDYLLGLTTSYLAKIETVDAVSEVIITSLGNDCIDIMNIKTDDKDGSIYDETNYSKIFVGDLSEKFIDIMKLIQELWQFSDYLDTYSTLELWDKGIKPKDKKHFLQILQLLHNKLRLLQFKAKKNREQ